MLGGWW